MPGIRHLALPGLRFIMVMRFWCCVWSLIAVVSSASAQAPCAATHVHRWVPVHTEATLRNDTLYAIPVVFHQLYENTRDTLSLALVQAQLDVLNQDFQGLHPNAASLPALFKNRVGNARLFFYLADTAPDGSYRRGLIRKQLPEENQCIGNLLLQFPVNGVYPLLSDDLGGSSPWDPRRYCNVYVAPFCDNSLRGLATWLTLSQVDPGDDQDVLVVNTPYFGPTQSGFFGSLNQGRTLTHEMGHYFGLQHIWAGNNGNCSGDDLIADTPPADGPHYGCPDFPTNSCGGPNMTMNFMDYTDDACLALFTQGQTAYMRAFLTNRRPGFRQWTASPMSRPPLLRAYPTILGAQERWIYLIWNAPENVEVEVRVFDAAGRQWTRLQQRGGQLGPVDAWNFPAGAYIIQARMGTNHSQVMVLKH